MNPLRNYTFKPNIRRIIPTMRNRVIRKSPPPPKKKKKKKKKQVHLSQNEIYLLQFNPKMKIHGGTFYIMIPQLFLQY